MSEVDLTTASSSPFDSVKKTRPNGVEFWSARDLMPLLGYKEWRKFDGSIDRAKVSAGNQGYDVDIEFVQVVGVVASDNPSGTERRDYELSRFAAYLVAMNGDPRKQQVSEAQAYFAIRTREAETAVARALPSRAELARMVLEEEAAKVEALRHNAVLVPKAQQFDKWQDSGDTMYVKEWSKALGMTRDAGFEHLRAMGVLSRRPRTDGVTGHLNVPNAGYESLFEMKQELLQNGSWALVPRMTPRGAVILAEMLVRRGRLSPQALGYAPLPALPGEAGA